MSVHPLGALEALAQLDRFDAVIDARSEDEYALDHVPGAVNWPSLNNAQRHTVGHMYKQVSPFEAQKLGAVLVARNVAAHIERELMHTPKSWRPLVYCWRGGQRSASLAHILGQIGFKVTLLQGGYKAYRTALLADMPARAAGLSYRVICGPTGCGKTRLLHALARAGAQVLDLEALACHRSSVLGALPDQAQPSTKAFDSLIWQALRNFNPERIVWVECESKKVGNLAVPDSLMQAMRTSPCVAMQLPDAERVALLLEDYSHLTRHTAALSERLASLVELRGRATVAQWQEQVRQGDFAALVQDLLQRHYDPGYAESTRRNFVQFAQARPIALPDRSEASMDAAAAQLLRADMRAADRVPWLA